MRIWSQRDDLIIRDGYRAGIAAAEIAAKIGPDVNRFQVIGRAFRLGLKHRYGVRGRLTKLAAARAAVRAAK